MKLFGKPNKKRRRRSGRTRKLIKAFVAGAGLGAAAGLLTPPKSATLFESSVEGSESEVGPHTRAAASEPVVNRGGTAKVEGSAPKPPRSTNKRAPAEDLQEPAEE